MTPFDSPDPGPRVIPSIIGPQMERRPVHAVCHCGEKWQSESTLLVSTRLVPTPPVWNLPSCPFCAVRFNPDAAHRAISRDGETDTGRTVAGSWHERTAACSSSDRDPAWCNTHARYIT